MDRYTALQRLLTELEDFLHILDKENLSSAAILKKCLLSEILQMYVKSNSSCDEEYIYMNKVEVSERKEVAGKSDSAAEILNNSPKEVLTNGTIAQHSAPPQKSLPDLPPPKLVQDGVQAPSAKAESPEGYYEEAEPYDASVNGNSLFNYNAANH
ncbi:actin filament-associated protein 1-like 2 [Pyxicephalus adspersus]|uniref:actin filament-associated protein 1-like 2 n=1 Tax=Pyxicephalus adspersus TaxID=30357 RepID=UPI003B5A110D